MWSIWHLLTDSGQWRVFFAPTCAHNIRNISKQHGRVHTTYRVGQHWCRRVVVIRKYLPWPHYILADTVYTEDVQEIDEAAVAVVRTGDDRSGAHSRHVGADAVAASVAGQRRHALIAGTARQVGAVQAAATRRCTADIPRRALHGSHTYYPPTPGAKKRCHPNHDYNSVNSWRICKILSLLQREH